MTNGLFIILMNRFPTLTPHLETMMIPEMFINYIPIYYRGLDKMIHTILIRRRGINTDLRNQNYS